ncbi:MAG: sulfite exporter TauE/SafE family protein [Ignavibacteria bacterium]
MELFSGFIIGLLGSFHCIGMCGPIVLSLPGGLFSKWSFIINRLLYNSGRIITYMLLGAVFGLLGNRLNLFGLQQMISIIIGILILTGVLAGLYMKKFNSLSILQIKIVTGLKKVLKINFDRRSKSTFLFTGIINGILPCGFVYIGLSGALVTGELTSGGIYMMMFGLGTIPLMLGLSLFGNFISLKFRNRLKKLIPVFAVILAVLFILRGLDLGIPFVSPTQIKDSEINNSQLQCN